LAFRFMREEERCHAEHKGRDREGADGAGRRGAAVGAGRVWVITTFLVSMAHELGRSIPTLAAGAGPYLEETLESARLLTVAPLPFTASGCAVPFSLW
jgi:hypothetical protein